MKMDSELLIAKLVLGYLKTEKCRTAYREFLRSSSHLQENKLSTNKYISTRYMGLSLVDILKQYFDLHEMVEAKLEETSYFSESHRNSDLVEQVHYLLTNGPVSRTSTPCPSLRSPSVSHCGGSSPPYRIHTNDVETTPAHELPGNVTNSEEMCLSRRSPRASIARNISTDGPNEKVSPKIPSDIKDVSQTSTNNANVHVPQVIDEVTEKDKSKSSTFAEIVKTALTEIEGDPMFKQLDAVIGSTNLGDNAAESTDKSSFKTSNATTNVAPNTSNCSKLVVTIDTQQNPIPVTNDLVDQQNQEAVQQITQVAQANQANSEVIVFNGTLDKYMMSNSVPLITSVPNPLYINTGGVFLPSTMPCALTPQQAPPLFVMTNPVTQQDIMRMPTVIVSESKPEVTSTKKRKVKIKPPNQPLLPSTCKPCPSSKESFRQGLKNVIYPKRDASKVSVALNPKCSTVTSDIKMITDSKPPSSLPEILTAEDRSLKTPPPADNTQKVTPKSSSHVRSLDFSTPPKITSSARKSLTTSLVRKADKENAAKSLFPSEESHSMPTNDKKPWDADLRVKLVTSTGDTPRQVKKKSAPRRRIRKTEKPDLNKTVQDAALIEAALKTPDPKKTRRKSTSQKESQEQVVENDKQMPIEACCKDEIDIVKPPEEGCSKMILSPSKLGISNKRNIMAKESEGATTFITPETEKPVTACPMKSNRNLTPMLETPMKQFLNTSQSQTPAPMNVTMGDNMTPFSKILEANFTCIDINEIPTPNAITPHFSLFTPNVDLISPYSNRPTDYSTGSSYYQPSDNEHNKSLEMHLLEMEKKAPANTTEVLRITTEHRDMFNKHIIGKKNLNLVKRQQLLSSTSESSDKSDSDNSSSVDTNKASNDTVIFREVTKHYSLRQRISTAPKKDLKVFSKKTSVKKGTPVKSENKANRKPPTKRPVKRIVSDEESEDDKVETEKDGDVKPKPEEMKQPPQVSVCREPEEKKLKTPEAPKSADKKPKTKSTHDQSKNTSHVSIVKEMEAKKMRTLEALKNAGNKPKRQNNKFMKIKPIPNIKCRKNKVQKSSSPRKSIEAMRNILKADLMDSDDSDTDFSSMQLYNDKVSQSDDTKSISGRKEVSGSDTEAQKLVEGLKERGIHLMHRKSPKLKNEEVELPQIESENLQKGSSEEPVKGPADNLQDEESLDIVRFDIENVHIVHDEFSIASTRLIEQCPKNLKFFADSEDIVLRPTTFNILLNLNVEDEELNNTMELERADNLPVTKAFELDNQQSETIIISSESSCVEKPNNDTNTLDGHTDIGLDVTSSNDKVTQESNKRASCDKSAEGQRSSSKKSDKLDKVVAELKSKKTKTATAELSANPKFNPKKLLLHRSAEETQKSIESILPKPDQKNTTPGGLSVDTGSQSCSSQDIEARLARPNNSPRKMDIVNKDLNISSSPKINDDLMNYAVSADLVQLAEPSELKESRKRKISPEGDLFLDEKNKKFFCDVDIDEFLEKLHGNQGQ